MNRFSSILILGVFALVISGGYVGYVAWDSSSDAKELKRVEVALADYQKQELIEKNQEILQSITAKRTLGTLTGDLIEWSEVMKEITRTLPREGGDAIVDILSYSGSLDSTISMNVKTLADSDDPYDDVADLIESFDDSEAFLDVFVPSISSSQDAEGKEVLSFLIATRYLDNYDGSK